MTDEKYLDYWNIILGHQNLRGLGSLKLLGTYWNFLAFINWMGTEKTFFEYLTNTENERRLYAAMKEYLSIKRKVLTERRATILAQTRGRTVRLYIDLLPPDIAQIAIEDGIETFFNFLAEDEPFIIAAEAHF